MAALHDEQTLSALAGAMLQEVLRRTHLSAAADIGRVASEEARVIGVSRLVLYVVDLTQNVLVPVPAPDSEGREPLPLSGTVAGRCYATASIIRITAGDGAPRLWVPLLDGTERLGAIEITFEPGDDPLPEAMVALCERYAHFIAGQIATKAAYSDFFDVLRGRGQVTAASELLWSLVPPLVLAGDGFVLAALLEPWNGLGGDAFDYAINGRTLDFAVFDAMGHDLTATGIAAFALAAYRASRRAGCDLLGIAAAIDRAVCEQPGPIDRFITALIARLDLHSGQLSWVCAGHPPPLLLRGGRFVKSLEVRPAPPLGVRLPTKPPVVAHESLEPGDLLLAYTDGLTEARRPGGQLFTVARLAEFIERQAAAGRPAPETLRQLREAILGRQEGTLRDDATAVLVEWQRGSERLLLPQTTERRTPAPGLRRP